ncbi:MAG TPA: BrnA antitoxin family protein [Stellaceae bacterium]|nr:BrnA antitoxin family protein [Stellaceae bacterium]
MKKGASTRKSAVATASPKTDWAAFDAITDEEIAAAIRDDPDVAPELDDEWFAGATLVMPQRKEQISIRLDRDVLEHFRRCPRYQTRINAILRAAMEHEKKAG